MPFDLSLSNLGSLYISVVVLCYQGYRNPKDATPNLKRERSSNDEVLEAGPKVARLDDMDNYSEAEEESE